MSGPPETDRDESFIAHLRRDRTGEERVSPALTIDRVARMFHLSRWRLRYYEWRGLIRRTRRGRGDAYAYRWPDCERVAFIVKARAVGLSLRHIEPVLRAMGGEGPPPLAARDRCAALIRYLELRHRTLTDALSELRQVDREFVQRAAGPGRG